MVDAPSPRLIAIVGATGTGKSALALDIAEFIRDLGGAAEIVNADAMQLYRGMNIGTAKLPIHERRDIPHHQLDVLSVTEEASVAAFQKHARRDIDAIIARGATPILVGGSGLYVSSVIYDFQFPGRDNAVRQRLEEELERVGPDALYQRLFAVDPGSAQRIDSRNTRRLIRSLEILEITGRPQYAALPDEPRYWLPVCVVGLADERERLVGRLNARVQSMWAEGMTGEVRALIDNGIEDGKTARGALGYAQAIRQIRGQITEQEAIEETAQLTRRYARRQVAWFKRYPAVTWLSASAERSENIHAARSALTAAQRSMES